MTRLVATALALAFILVSPGVAAENSASPLIAEVRKFEQRQWPSIHIGDTIAGEITDSDYLLSFHRHNAKIYTLNALGGDTVTIHFRSNDFATFLFVVGDPEGPFWDPAVDSGSNDSVVGFRIPKTGTYWIVATPLTGGTGHFTLTLKGGEGETLASSAEADACTDNDVKYSRDEQIHGCNAAIRNGSDRFDAFYNRGITRFRDGDYVDAVGDFEKAVDLNPSSADATYALGRACYELKQFENAVYHFGEAIRLKPDDANAFYMRGLARRHLGNEAGAKMDIARATELDPQIAGKDRASARRP